MRQQEHSECLIGINITMLLLPLPPWLLLPGDTSTKAYILASTPVQTHAVNTHSTAHKQTTHALHALLSGSNTGFISFTAEHSQTAPHPPALAGAGLAAPPAAAAARHTSISCKQAPQQLLPPSLSTSAVQHMCCQPAASATAANKHAFTDIPRSTPSLHNTHTV
jgi:hypothetical protein